MTREPRPQKRWSQTAATAIALASFFFSACSHVAPVPPSPASPLPAALQASPNRLVGRILAIDATRGFAFVNLASEPPAAALVAGAELSARTDELRETARLRTSRYVRGHTLGTTIISGQPTPGDEVVFHAP